MRVAIFTDTYLPQINGVSKTLYKLKQYLDKEEIEYRFFVPGNDLKADLIQNIITFQSFNFFLYPDCKIALPNNQMIKNVLSKFKPDLIHCTTPFSLGLTGMKYAKDNNIPLVSSYHTSFDKYLEHYKLQFLEKPLWHFFRWFHSYCEINFCPSEETRKELKKQGINNIEIWGRGIDTQKFSTNYYSAEYRKNLGVVDENILLYVGRIAAEKELDVLLAAVKILNRKKLNYKLLLVGDGPIRARLESLQLPNVIFTGYKSGEELQTIYASADLFLFPSSSETYGNVILEAMASGLPVIAPFAGGVKENLIHQYNGLAFQAGDAEDMAIAAERLLKDNQLKLHLRDNALQHSLSKSWDSVFKNLFAHYQLIIDRSREVRNKVKSM